MPSNTEVIESFYADPANLLNLVDADVEWITMPGIPYGGVHRGPDQVRQNVMRHVAADWENFKSTLDTLMEAGDDCIVALGRYSGTFKATGKTLADCDFAHIFRLRNGRIVQLRQYVDSAIFNAVMS